MLEAWLERGIRRSSMRRLIAAVALLAAYAYWLFARQSPWAAPFSLLGAEMPELIAGFPAQEPAAALKLPETQELFALTVLLRLPLLT